MARTLWITALVLGLLVGTGTADAHAFLVTADPAAGAVLKTPPTAVTILFTEALEPSFSSLTVSDDSGTRVDLDDAHTLGDGTRYAVGLKPLKPGSYKVVWHATSVDTHKTSGRYEFTVEP
jgi:methionine-rich copper-binding protein CopC